MSEPDNGALGEILTTFLDESLDALREADAHLVALEADHSDHEGLEAVFRVLHSIKGNAAVFGLDAIKHLAHAMEDQLDQVRSKVREVDQPLISAVLAGCDLLRKGLNGVRSGAELAKDDLDRVLAAFGPVVPVVQGVDPERWAHVLGQAQELAEDLAVLPGDSGQRMAVLLDQLRHISSGSEGGVGDAGNPEERLAAFLAEPVPEQMTEDQIDSLRDLVSQVEDGAEDDAARALVEEMHEGFDTFADSVGFDDLFRGWLLDRVERIADEGAWAWHREAAQQAATAGRSGHSDGKTMRVAEHHIDTFLAYVGELLVVGDMFSHIQRRLDGAASSELVESFRRANETFEGLSNDLQTSIMSIRLVAVEAILQRVPRLVRDVATDLHKDIDAVIEGEGVRIDKSLLELLDAPLTHMVRNAADHGIESIDERKAAGKPSTGTIVVRVRETDTEVLLEVEDDGRGLNLEAIQAAAIRHGLIRAGAELDENAIVDLIFSSGVSTAQGVSEFSGRGVGMDVVKQNIVEAGGSIGVTTMDGQGARFTIRLPKAVTTQIIPGYLVRSEGQTYVLPMDRVQETTRIHREEISFIPQRGWCLRRRGSVVPVFNLANMLNAMATTDVVVNGNEQVAIALESRGTDVALVVDQVLGVQKVVLRRIDGLPLGHTLVTGGALLGDGSVSLIIDVDGIIGSGVPTP